MPNPEVKPARADGTAWGTCGRAGRRQINFYIFQPVDLFFNRLVLFLRTLQRKEFRLDI